MGSCKTSGFLEIMGPFNSFQFLLVCLGLFLITCNAFESDEVHALTTFKEAIYEDPFMIFSNWNALDSDPCSWSGVVCSMARDHVIQINISEASLKGFLARELSLISSLEELILHRNYLIGTIPKEFGMLKNLKVLDLGMNSLTGPIPPEIGNLINIVKINLQSNALTGSLPIELANLKNLEELWLDRNNLRGTVLGSNPTDFGSNMHGMHAPNRSYLGFCRSSQLKAADFSNNFFDGRIPRCLQYLPRSSFTENCLQERYPKQRPASQCGGNWTPPPKSHPKDEATHQPVGGSKHQAASKPPWLLALEILTGVVVGSFFFVGIFTVLQRCKCNSSIIIPWKKSSSDKDHMRIYIDSELLKNVKRFSRQELEVACEDFSNIIRSSSESLVHKGTIEGGHEIAVISLCIKDEHWTGFLELYFQREVADLARLNHDNTGKLLGYCRDSTPFTRMLVFEYAANGTLYEHLHYGDGCQLSWARRMKIVIGIAKGLKYLHTELYPPFTIYELNSSAVYLTEDFSPKLVDFQNWESIFSRSEKNSSNIGNEGAICVLPKSLEKRHLDIQGNIYAFGVLLLEMVSGRPPCCKEKGCLVDWAKEYLELPDIMSEMVDPQLKYFKYNDLKVICEVATLCINPSPDNSVSLQEVCTILQSKIDLSVAAELNGSSLEWAALALSS